MRAPILEAGGGGNFVEMSVVDAISAYAVQSDLVAFNTRGNAIV